MRRDSTINVVFDIFNSVSHSSFIRVIIWPCLAIALSELTLIFSGLLIIKKSISFQGDIGDVSVIDPNNSTLFCFILIATVARIVFFRRIVHNVHSTGRKVAFETLLYRLSAPIGVIGAREEQKLTTTILTSHLQTFVSVLLTVAIAIVGIFSLIGIMTATIITNSFRALIPLGLLALIYWLISILIGIRIRWISKEIDKQQVAILVGVTELLSSIDEIKISGRATEMIHKVDNKFSRLMSALTTSSILSAFPKQLIEGLLFLLLLYLGTGETGIGSKNAAFIAETALLGVRLLPLIQGIYAAQVNLKTYREILLTMKKHILNKPIHRSVIIRSSLSQDWSSSAITLSARWNKNLVDKGRKIVLSMPDKFEIDGEQMIISDNNSFFELSQGCIVAIEGQSGIGKTTYLKLLASTFRNSTLPEKESLIKGVSSDYAFNDDFNVIYLQQDSKVMTGSLLSNMSLEEKCYQLEEAAELLIKFRLANTLKEANTLLTTKVGEGSTRHLSGGEIKRLMLCRALLNKPKLLFLDEITAGLDYENEELIFGLLRYTETISIIVTHSVRLQEEADLRISLNRSRG